MRSTSKSRGGNMLFIKQEYFYNLPGVTQWYEAYLPTGLTGAVCMNDARTLVTGALVQDAQLGENYENLQRPDLQFYYSTYVVEVGTAGVQTVEKEINDGVYRVYNLQGVKVYEGNNEDALKSLGKGLYIVNGKKVML